MIDEWLPPQTDKREYRHWEETHCSERELLIDTGLGICNIYDEVRKLTDKPVTAVATHIHWDHIGDPPMDFGGRDVLNHDLFQTTRGIFPRVSFLKLFQELD